MCLYFSSSLDGSDPYSPIADTCISEICGTSGDVFGPSDSCSLNDPLIQDLYHRQGALRFRWYPFDKPNIYNHKLTYTVSADVDSDDEGDDDTGSDAESDEGEYNDYASYEEPEVYPEAQRLINMSVCTFMAAGTQYIQTQYYQHYTFSLLLDADPSH